MKPMASVERGQIDDEAAYAAIEALYHAYLTGLILMLVTRAGADKAAEVVFRTFRRQQLARFVPAFANSGSTTSRTPSPAPSITTCPISLAA
jgi:hypothetical protein